MNSRDAAYDDAIALSILEAGSAAMRARLERGGKVEGEGVGDESDEEVVEEIVIGPGRGRKKSASAAERAERGAKSGGAKKGAAGASKKGGKGCVSAECSLFPVLVLRELLAFSYMRMLKAEPTLTLTT